MEISLIPMENTLKKTSLFACHEKDRGKLVPFAGWHMPVEYRGIMEEHRAVRNDKGLFDLSHMGEFHVSGEGAASYINGLITNDLSTLVPGQALYTAMCKPDGGILDDMVIYRLTEDHGFYMVVNAGNIDKIFAWMKERLPSGVSLVNKSDETALLAIQGPNAEAFLQPFCSIPIGKIGYYHSADGKVKNIPALISRTGYTGEDGFELYVDAGKAPEIWEALREKGIPPIGLGARDTLRLESAYLLYGNDMDETTSPLEVGLAWVVKLNKDFTGKDALVSQKQKGIPRKQIAFEMKDRAIPRKDYKVFANGKPVGKVTSGTFSPSKGKGIGLALVDASSGLKEGAELEIEVRGQNHPAAVCKKPFVQGSVKRGT